MDTDHTWVRHLKTGGFWLCPTGVLAEMREQGWEPTEERPREPNPAIDERIAWEAEQARKREAAAAATTTSTTGAARRGEKE